MSSKELSISFLRCLYRLSLGEELKAGEISSKSLLKKFIDDGLIKVMAISKQRRVYICPNPQGLSNYLRAQYEILSLESFIEQKEGNRSDGQQSLQAIKSTKAFREKGLQGFFIKAYDTKIFIDEEEIPTTPQGIELFIHQPEKLRLSPDAVVLGVENPECFVKFKELRGLFSEKELVVVMRYMSLSPNKWLSSIPNPYLHFGDFDPAGISIYINEYRNKLPDKKCNFFIPANIEDLIKQYGSTSLYDKQSNQLTSWNTSDYPELQHLVHVINKYRMGLEQERLLSIG